MTLFIIASVLAALNMVCIATMLVLLRKSCTRARDEDKLIEMIKQIREARND